MSTLVQIKRSSSNATPATLTEGELAYSYVSNTLFVGNTTNVAINIGGQRYTSFLDQGTSSNSASTFVRRAANGSAQFSQLEILVAPTANSHAATKEYVDLYSVSSNAAFAQANLAYAQSNAVFIQANNAYSQANNGLVQANNAYNQSNSASVQANSAYNTANDAYIQANSAFSQSNTAYNLANSSYSQANSAYNQSNTAYDQANSAYNQANTVNSYANTVYDQANNSYSQANLAYAQANNAYGEANLKLDITGGTITGNLVIQGNLAVLGNVTTLNVDVLQVEDNEIILNSNVTGSPVLDAFITINRGSDPNVALKWNESLGNWQWTDDGSNYYSFNSALDAYGQANNAYAQANSGYGQANSSYNQANTSYLQANAAYSQANAAHLQANSAYGAANGAYSQANSAYAQANNAYNEANNRVLKTGDTMTGQLNISSGGLIVLGSANVTQNIVTGNINTTSLIVTGPADLSTLNITTPLSTNSGGTGLSTFVANGVFYANTTNNISFVSGTDGQVLSIVSGIPTFSALSANLTVKEIFTSNSTVVNSFSNISTIQFDADSGLAVIDELNNTVTIQLNSTFKFWQVNGSPGLTAVGLDTVNFVTGYGIEISANNANTPKSIIFTAPLIGTVYDLANNKVSKSGDNMTGDLNIDGALNATTKSFVIKHPTNPDKKLRYGSLEGPENGVYVRGVLRGYDIIHLPDYWNQLVHEDSITAILTPVKKFQKLYIKDIKDNKVYVGNDSFFGEIYCSYIVYGERKDVERLRVEY